MSPPVIRLHQEPTLKQRKRQAPKGRGLDPHALQEVQGLLGNASRSSDELIEHLHRLQDAYGQLNAKHLSALAHEMRISQAQVYEVASFYHHFDIVKEGQTSPATLTVRVCDGLSCEMAGAKNLLTTLPSLLGKTIRVIPAPCIGRCEQAPAAMVGQHAIASATPEKIKSCVDSKNIQAEPTHHISYSQYKAAGGYALLTACMTGQRDVESVIQEVETSGLRGLGGAGFGAGRKWRILKTQKHHRLMVINLDEGEPGTFKDRTLLETDPHRFLEGMLIAAWAVEIPKIYIYLRDEYHACRVMLQAELQLLKDAPPCSGLPEVILRRGAGAYICGEESALIESIEGKRGIPRLRPPYVAEVGLFNQPTLVHNFETLFWVREILERGGAWFASHGLHDRKGLRSFSVSGRVRLPGVKLAPAGITIQQLIDDFCGGMQEGHHFYGYLPGGASGGILPATLNQIPLDFDTLQAYGCFIGSAAVIVLSQHDTARNAALNMMRFFKHESCGQCTPCRVGTAKAEALMAKSDWDLPLLQDLSTVMRDASICGLGQAAPNPMDCVIKYFPHELTSSLSITGEKA